MSEINTVKWVLRKVRRRIPLMIFLILSDMGGSVLSVMFALGSKGVINSAVSGSMDAFWRACGIQLAIIAGTLIFNFISRYLVAYLTDILDRDWKKELFQSLLYGEYAEVSAFHSGELVNRLNNDVRILNDGIISAVPNLASLVTRLTAAVITMFAMMPKLTLILTVLGLAAMLLTSFVRKKLKNLHRNVSEQEGKVLGFLQENLEKLLVIQAMDLSDQVEKRADKLLNGRLRVQRRRRRVSLAANTGVSILFYACGFVSLAWCSYGLLQGTMDFGTMTAIIQLVNQVQAPFISLSGFLPRFAAMMAAAERLMELEMIKREDAASIEDVPAYYEKLTEFRSNDITFAYDDKNILEHTSFSLNKGTFSAITGPSGIGKSTLLKLMLGVYRPQEGKLTCVVDGREEKLGRSTRGLFAYVPQGNLLFSGSLRENLLLIAPKAGEKEIEQAVYVSAMDAFLPELPDGLDTIIGERGEGLSEGQAQRVSIARAVLSGAPVLLLDEATSALDGETEATVLQRISALQGRTCIAVTHRPAALALADYRLEVSERSIKVISLK